MSDLARASISAIDASHQDVATAYVAMDHHSAGDYRRTRIGRTTTERRGRKL
jgi:hypothetical protein